MYFRTDVLGESGLCGMLINPMYATGGYILDEQGRYIDPSRTAHYPIFVTNWEHWLQDNWRVRTIPLLRTSKYLHK